MKIIDFCEEKCTVPGVILELEKVRDNFDKTDYSLSNLIASGKKEMLNEIIEYLRNSIGE